MNIVVIVELVMDMRSKEELFAIHAEAVQVVAQIRILIIVRTRIVVLTGHM